MISSFFFLPPRRLLHEKIALKQKHWTNVKWKKKDEIGFSQFTLPKKHRISFISSFPLIIYLLEITNMYVTVATKHVWTIKAVFFIWEASHHEVRNHSLTPKLGPWLNDEIAAAHKAHGKSGIWHHGTSLPSGLQLDGWPAQMQVFNSTRRMKGLEVFLIGTLKMIICCFVWILDLKEEAHMLHSLHELFIW